MVVDAADTEKVQIVLQNVSIDCSDHAALFIKQADKVFLTLAEGTENTLSSGSSYALGDDDSNVDGVIFSRADLTMNGSGSLAVNAAYKHAVVSKDDLVVTGGQYAIKAENGGGLYGKDCVKITGGAFTIATGTDAIQANNAEKADQGYVYISGGTFDLTAGTDAVQAETVLRIDGGHVPDHQRRRQCKRQHRQIRKGFARLGYVGASERAESLTGCRIHRHIRQRKRAESRRISFTARRHIQH